jgi:hypothetical protein
VPVAVPALASSIVAWVAGGRAPERPARRGGLVAPRAADDERMHGRRAPDLADGAHGILHQP